MVGLVSFPLYTTLYIDGKHFKGKLFIFNVNGENMKTKPLLCDFVLSSVYIYTLDLYAEWS